ncbi:hypothetical protein RO3G_07371 [Rhizopus delemar RA 99-880]|uniref:Uncharacterized protein n=1 Tax=Rhizopus delemar (strain RA 99-880 / ATCC MYA-4621 / FGSC 9543 / NRRL 43880) TaxID=246409 RepID=I1C2I6_RHIO9|nr:hypothetical protein RO3G_07371 [Rhizopus delemar RA 99-880]|eukprot:EIE82666.1 hypothetical protein RO3G_07371 [Rhizopus delemar RA 99-880]
MYFSASMLLILCDLNAGNGTPNKIVLRPTIPIANADRESLDLAAHLDRTETHSEFVQYKLPLTFLEKTFPFFVTDIRGCVSRRKQKIQVSEVKFSLVTQTFAASE